MKKLIVVSLALICTSITIAQDIETYFREGVSQGDLDYATERSIVEKYKSKRLISTLEPYLEDSLPKVRSRAHYLLSQKARQASTSPRDKERVTTFLLQSIEGETTANASQYLTYLKLMPPSVFNDENNELIEGLLSSSTARNYEQLLLLAGYSGAGGEWMQRHFLLPQTPAKDKWSLALALARQGSELHTAYCLDKVRSIPLSDGFISYVVPQLIYSRQKALFDFCVEVLNNTEKLCQSADADNPTLIACGYPVMHLLAPVVRDYPYQLDASGTIAAADYKQALVTIQEWFATHPDYEIIDESY